MPKGTKRRRITSPLSDEDEDAEDADEDHSMAGTQEPPAATLKTPATPIVSKGLKAPPVPVLSGARPNARAGKKRAPGASGPAPAANPPVNGVQASHPPKIKQEDDMDDRESVSETATTATAPEETAGMSIDVNHVSFWFDSTETASSSRPRRKQLWKSMLVAISCSRQCIMTALSVHI